MSIRRVCRITTLALISAATCQSLAVSDNTIIAAPQTQQDRSVELIDQLGGEVRGVVINESFAYVSNAARILVLSLEDTGPRLIGKSPLLPATIKDLVVIRGVVVAALGHLGIAIVDVRDPVAPKVVARMLTDRAYHIEATSNYALVFAGETILTLDVSDPRQPIVTASFGPFLRLTDDRTYITLRDDWLVVVGNRNLAVIDVTNPRSLSVIKYLENIEVSGLAMSKAAVFIAVQVINPDTHDCRMVLHALDRRAGTLLAEMGGVDLPVCDLMSAMLVTDGQLIVRYGGHLQFVDVSDPSRMVPGRRVDLPGGDSATSNPTRMKQMMIEGTRLYLTANPGAMASPGVVVVDLVAGGQPQVAGTWLQDEPVSVRAAAMAGRVLVLAGISGATTYLYDTTASGSPELLTKMAFAAAVSDIAAEGKWLVMVQTSGVRVVDLTVPQHPVTRDMWSLRNDAIEVAITGESVYVGVAHNSESGPQWYELLVFRLSTAGKLELQRRVDVCESPIVEMQVHEDTLYVACRDEGLVVMDVSDRYRPKRGASIGGWTRTKAMAVHDGLAVIASHDPTPQEERELVPYPRYAGLHLVDIDDPQALSARDVFATRLGLGADVARSGNAGWGLVAAGDQVLMAAEEHALRVFDVRDATRVQEEQVLTVPSIIGALTSKGQYVYGAGQEGGLYVFRVPAMSADDTARNVYLPLTILQR